MRPSTRRACDAGRRLHDSDRSCGARVVQSVARVVNPRRLARWRGAQRAWRIKPSAITALGRVGPAVTEACHSPDWCTSCASAASPAPRQRQAAHRLALKRDAHQRRFWPVPAWTHRVQRPLTTSACVSAPPRAGCAMKALQRRARQRAPHCRAHGTHQRAPTRRDDGDTRYLTALNDNAQLGTTSAAAATGVRRFH